MATVKLKFRPSTVSGKEGTVYYQIILHHNVRLIKSAYQLMPSEWNDTYSAIHIPATGARHDLIKLVCEKITWERKQLQMIANEIEAMASECSIDEITARFKQIPSVETVFTFMTNQIVKLRQQRKIRTSEAYLSTLNRFRKFRDDKDLCFESIDSNMMELFESHLKECGLIRNSTSFYFRILRTTYRLAVERGYTADRLPFRHVYTGIDKTVKRAIPIEYIKKIKELDLTADPHLDFARDIFLFSFYTRGMSFVDIAYLKKTNLRNGFITYFRKKTGQRLTIFWEKQMAEITKKYNTDTEYILPIITNDNYKHRQYRAALKQIDRNLKKVAAKVKLNIPLTLYVARHSWASIAESKDIPIATISEGMGHDSETTTRIYLKSLDTSIIDRANRKILGSL